jgi:hypothetical protein
LLGLFFEPEDEGDMFLRNVGSLTTDYAALYLITTGVRTSNPTRQEMYVLHNILILRRGESGMLFIPVKCSLYLYDYNLH